MDGDCWPPKETQTLWENPFLHSVLSPSSCYSIHHSIAESLTLSQTQKDQPRSRDKKIKKLAKCLSTNKWLGKMWHVYLNIYRYIFYIFYCVCISIVYVYIFYCVCVRILFSHKKEWNLAICNNMDRPEGHYANWMLIEVSDRVWQMPYNFTYSWNLKTKQVNK